jgi:hypothetical protein
VSAEAEARKLREEVERLENTRLQLSKDVMHGRPGAIEEDQRLEKRIRELGSRLHKLKQGGRGNSYGRM